MYQPVSVPKAAFAFCRYVIAILIWISLVLRIKCGIILVFVILVLSTILTVKWAPLVVIYTYTIDKLIHSRKELLDVKAMRFAHILGSVMALISLILLYFVNESIGWAFVLLFAILKTISAFGFCSASKLYGCIMSGGCCALTKNHAH